MSRLHFIVEGQTEETFVNTLLAPHLGQFHVFADVRRVETSRTQTRIYRGGLFNYIKAKNDLQRWARQEHRDDVYFTTMFDLYRLPPTFPGYAIAQQQSDPYQRVDLLERALAADLNYSNFIPYIQLYEFETLLFADAEQFDWEFLESEAEIAALCRLAEEFGNPELINDSPETAPSKRIIQLIPDYEGRKASAGPLIAQKIGIDTLRKRCTHFGQWLQRLEKLA